MVALSPTIRRAVLSIARKHRVESVRVFGSIARGAGKPESDLDLLVKFADKTSLFVAIGFQQELEDTLNCKVDVVDEGGMSPYLRESILAGAVSL